MTFKGIVVKGSGKAAETGYPTANIYCPDLNITGGWMGIIKISHYESKYIIGVAVGKIFECHILNFDGDIYNQEFKFELVKQINISGDISDDITRYENRKCSNCRYCLLQEYGYSAWTVLGEYSECVLGLRGKFDYSSYELSKEDLEAVNCDKYRFGEPVEEKLK